MHVTLTYTEEIDGDSELHFMLAMGRVPAVGEMLTFEAPPTNGLDQVNIEVTGVNESFYLTSNGSDPLTEIDAEVRGLSARPTDRDKLIEAIRAHSVVSDLHD